MANEFDWGRYSTEQEEIADRWYNRVKDGLLDAGERVSERLRLTGSYAIGALTLAVHPIRTLNALRDLSGVPPMELKW